MTTPFFQRLIDCKNPGESDAAFCRRLDINPSIFQRWRHGQMPMVQTVARIANKTGKTSSWLLFGNETQDHGKEGNAL